MAVSRQAVGGGAVSALAMARISMAYIGDGVNQKNIERAGRGVTWRHLAQSGIDEMAKKKHGGSSVKAAAAWRQRRWQKREGERRKYGKRHGELQRKAATKQRITALRA